MTTATIPGRRTHERLRPQGTARTVAGSAAVVALITGVLGLAPTEATMGHAQRVLYVHVPVAWLGLLGFVAVAATGVLYLIRRDLEWDHWARAAAELGWLCSTLTLVTGSLWARSAWGTWWTWDPRLITSFVLWAIYGGYLVGRGSVDDPHRRARLAAVLAVVGVLDVPLVVMATRWFRAIHPASPTLEPAMRLALALTALGLGAFLTLLVVCRRDQLRLEHRLRGSLRIAEA
jgi:heme exporter protein C